MAALLALIQTWMSAGKLLLGGNEYLLVRLCGHRRDVLACSGRKCVREAARSCTQVGQRNGSTHVLKSSTSEQSNPGPYISVIRSNAVVRLVLIMITN